MLGQVEFVWTAWLKHPHTHAQQKWAALQLEQGEAPPAGAGNIDSTSSQGSDRGRNSDGGSTLAAPVVRALRHEHVQALSGSSQGSRTPKKRRSTPMKPQRGARPVINTSSAKFDNLLAHMSNSKRHR